jgi:ATP-dependent helicase/nuclease subunit B
MSYAELIAELTAGATVVTANDRLSRALQQAVADHNLAQGLKVWATPKALTLGALLDQQLEALCASGDPAARRCLERHEAEALWERIIDTSARGTALLQLRALAKLAFEARGIALRHRLGDYTTGESGQSGAIDAREFKRWHEVYRKRLEELHATDAAALPDLIADAWSRGIVVPPQRVTFAGFDEFTPQAAALATAMAAAGAKVTRPMGNLIAANEEALPAGATRVVLDDAQSEIERAAAWAAARLSADPALRIGVVVPDLQDHRAAVIDAFDAMLAPAGYALGAESAPPLYNLSLGLPLASWPLVSDALRALALTKHEVEWRDASVVLRSPFFKGAPPARAALELWIRAKLPERFALEALAGHDDDPFFAELVALRPASREQRLPSAWAAQTSKVLETLGWPGPRRPDRAERQTLEAWDEALRAACRLDAVLGPVTWARFLARLAAIAQDRDFQPRATPAPIQVLGYLEAAVLEFDRLWVMGMDDERWPPAARPNPLLPLRLQAEKITPSSSAAERLVHAQRITAKLLAAAPAVIVSTPAHEGDAEHRPSPLIAALPVLDATTLPAFRPLAAPYAPAATERFGDAPVPLAASPARGGTSAIQHQAACPFRAFAEHRLGAEALEAPREASDAASRGRVIHDVLKRVWDELRSKAALDATSETELLASVKRHVEAAVAASARADPAQWPLRLKVLEHARLTARVLEWLSVERARAPFTVVATEAPRELKVGALTLRGRVDRIDEVDGGKVYIDYKTGKVDWRRWLGARPKEPQLPLYAITGEGDAKGVVFARVRVGDHGFAGLSPAEDLAPGVDTWPPATARGEAVKGALHDAPDREALQRYWRGNLERLAAEFVAGHAVVDPERDACRYCHLPMLCRIDELGGAAASDEEGDDA